MNQLAKGESLRFGDYFKTVSTVVLLLRTHSYESTLQELTSYLQLTGKTCKSLLQLIRKLLSLLDHAGKLSFALL